MIEISIIIPAYNVEKYIENEFRKKERAIKKYNMLAYKKLLFDYYPALREGNFGGVLISKNEFDKTEKYELTDNFWWCEIPDPVVNEQLVTVEDFWGKEHKARLVSKPDEPYLVYEYVEKHVEKRYNPNYGDDRMCVCGHPYYRHFDSYDHMEAVGCKYCGCQKFIEKKENEGEELCTLCK